jgi:hypothetical protein
VTKGEGDLIENGQGPRPSSKQMHHPSPLPAYASKQNQNLVLAAPPPRETETTGKDTHMVTLLLLLEFQKKLLLLLACTRHHSFTETERYKYYGVYCPAPLAKQ